MDYGVTPYDTNSLVLWDPAPLEKAGNYTSKLLSTAYQLLPNTEPSHGNALQTLGDAYEIGRKIYNHPLSFTYHLIDQVSADMQNELQQKVQSAAQGYFAIPSTSFSCNQGYYFEKAQETMSFFFSLLAQGKQDLKRMFIDLFTVFVIPLSAGAENTSFSSNALEACSMTAAALAIHQFSLTYFQEDPTQAKSLTCGAIMGIWTSFVMDQSLFMGMLSGACVALVTDTALVALSRNAFTKLLKKQYKEWEVEKKVTTIYKLSKEIFPYIFYTLGTAFVYAKLRPLTDLLLKDTPPSSQKIYTIQLIATSAMLFGMGTSYLITTTKSLIGPLIVGGTSAQQTSRLIFWAPRVLSILFITSITSNHFNKKVIK